jgi:cytochrome c oxidase assembly protein subunit 15
MPFDVRDFRAGAPDQAIQRNRRLVAGWLFAMCGMILAMIVLGGATRLTGSGLSIMEWAPLRGVLPPLSQAEWVRLYGLYQRIPQYELVNHGIGIDGFKRIFWLEWVHRLWGRVIGVAFLLPLIWLWARGAIEKRLRPLLALLFIIGGLQGAVGWFMVASGFFPESTAVSAYRLVIHLALALALYAALLWTGLSTLRPQRSRSAPEAVRRMIGIVVPLIVLTILAGGFVAGLHAGLTYNTFPLMGGNLVPADYGQLHPFLRNLTENVAAVQFDHRLLATLTAVAVAITVGTGLRLVPSGAARSALLALAVTVALQYGLGVAALLWVVPLPLAIGHQAVAILTLTAALVSLHVLRRGADPLLSPN